MSDQSLLFAIRDEMKSSMRCRDMAKLSVIRMLLAAIKQREIDDKITLDDFQIVSIVNKMIRQRKDALGYYTKANRQDLAAKEEFEIAVLMGFVPDLLLEEEVDAIIEGVIREIGSFSIGDMAKIMQTIKVHLKGRADMGKVAAKVKVFLEKQN